MDFMLSYLHGLDTSAWHKVASTTGSILLILVLAWIVHRIASRLMIAGRKILASRTDDADRIRRLETLGRAARYILTVAIAAITIMLVLDELGISVAPILATAGVAGIAIGFGAQTLVKDFFTGVFLLIEDQIRQGDVVQLGEQGGLVEEVTLRHVRLRDFNGHVHYVPNGSITIVTNRTREYAQAVIEVGVAYRENVDEALEVMREVGQQMRADPVFGAKILDDTEIIGVENWADSAVILRCRLKVVGIEQWNVRREFLRRLKQAFDARGIEIPYPHLTVYAGQAKDGSAPALQVVSRGA